MEIAIWAILIVRKTNKSNLLVLKLVTAPVNRTGMCELKLNGKI